MRFFIILFYILPFVYIYSQNQNEVYNPHFEQKEDGSSLFDGTNCYNPYSRTTQNNSEESSPAIQNYYNYIYGWDAPKRKALCLSVGSADVYCNELMGPNAINSHTGRMFAHTAEYEGNK